MTHVIWNMIGGGVVIAIWASFRYIRSLRKEKS
jgi:hypothetical protein